MSYLNYMELESKIFERLRAIDWFANCTQPSKKEFGFTVVWVPDWQAATKCLSDPEWDNTILEAGNILTSHLAKKYSREFQEWNKLVREAKLKLIDLFKVAEVFQQKNNLNKSFLDSFKWNILSIVMEETYKSCRPPICFANMLEVYASGHCVCGWRGEWPNGNLMAI